MIDFRQLKKYCAACGKPDSECPNCQNYKILNTPCAICNDIGGVMPFAIATKTGNKTIQACNACIEFLT